jgi:hypothetical protein
MANWFAYLLDCLDPPPFTTEEIIQRSHEREKNMTKKAKEENKPDPQAEALRLVEAKLTNAVDSLIHLNRLEIGTAFMSEQVLIWPELAALTVKLPILSVAGRLVEHKSDPQYSVLEFRFFVDQSLLDPDSPARKALRTGNQNEAYRLSLWVDAVKDIDPATHLTYVKGSFEAIKRMKPLKDKIKELEGKIEKYHNESPRMGFPFPMFGPMARY